MRVVQREMLRRLIIVGMIATVLVVTRAGAASACSCMPLQPAEAIEQFDAAFVGTLVDQPDSMMPYDEEAPYRFHVETWVKGDLGGEVVVLAPNQGSACGFEAPVGERIGVLLTIEDGKVAGNLCTQVSPDLLLAADTLLVEDGRGPPVFLLAGYSGPARLMLLDASGGLVATVGEDDEQLGGLGLCPETGRLVELVDDELVVRASGNLAEVRRIDLNGLPYRQGVSNIWCRHPEGQVVWLTAEEWSESTGNVSRLFDASDLSRPLVEGDFGWLQPGARYAIAGEGPTGRRIWRIDLESGAETLLHEIPFQPGDSQPSGRGWVDPSGTRAMITQWRYRDDSGGSTTLFLYDLETGALIWQSETLPTADGIGWADETRFLAYAYPDIDSDQVDEIVIDTDRLEIAHEVPLAGWMEAGEYRVGVSNYTLQAAPLAGGDPVDLRLLPSETHRLVAVLDPDATVTPTTTPAVGPSSGGVASSPTGEESPGLAPEGGVVLLAGAALILILVGAALGRRRIADRGE